ncbi:tRNA (N6-threonylcarbamoyladenosine(37)-N6)-methyltransferase TrmO [Candidatus Dependentiae bacterium]|nr:tRNA (N6-threonylcarbamoyladenosine(37)-N6)-methyltransferase TrmO [Candidatus Dependentiae bacterium]
MENKIILEPIGIIHTPYTEQTGTLIQPRGAIGIKGEIEIFEKFKDGLTDIAGFYHIYVLYYFHKINEVSLKVKPFLDDCEHGIFSVRSPKRPNKIGLSVVRLIRVENNILHIENVDMLNKTPVIDIKPYVPDFDIFDVEKIGWLDSKSQNCEKNKDDGRFTPKL